MEKVIPKRVKTSWPRGLTGKDSNREKMDLLLRGELEGMLR